MKQSGAEDWQMGGFGLYVHWPFCLSKCPYCDFNSHVSAKVDHSAWHAALMAELRRVGQETAGRTLGSIFFGGGTPSLMDPALVGDLISEAKRIWTPANDLEITLEANPTSIESNRFSDFRQAGVNRISIGIQALSDESLRKLGRTHSVQEALKGLEIARNHFERVSFDLIYGRQGQTLSDWRNELSTALTIAADHISLYHLTIEDGTVFSERARRGLLSGLPSEDLSADLFIMTQELCGAAGYPAYEVSNHSVPGFECRHNEIYWSAGDYVGIGPGAHGRMTIANARFAIECERQPEAWLLAVDKGSGERERSSLTPQEQGREYLIMGLRHRDGIDIARYERMSGRSLKTSALEHLGELDLILRDGFQLRVHPDGRILLDSIISALSE